MVFKVEVD